MGVAWVVRALHPKAGEWPARLRNFSFGMWITAMFLITSNASDFLRQHADTPHRILLKIAAASLLVCIASFAIGRMIGGREFSREASQSLGQKNTTFTIYLALTYASPIRGAGPHLLRHLAQPLEFLAIASSRPQAVNRRWAARSETRRSETIHRSFLVRT
jgi:BASS family bile acid:Na+ symporter